MSRNRNFIFTFNNYPEDHFIDTIQCKYVAYSHEIAPTTGTRHLQGWITFHDAKTITAARSALPGCHVLVMHGSLAQNDTYISKENSQTLTERGEKPISNDNKGRAEKLRWQRARDLAKEGNLEEIDADIYIRCYSTLKSIAKDHMVKPPPCDVRCYWIHGDTGTGKSHAVETAFPDCYKKPMDDLKWFDLYQEEDVIYLEDIDVYQVKWGGLLKRLADKWPMMASIKGTMKYIRPKMVIVTSNYTPGQIWVDDQTLQPLLRRFKVIEKLSQEQVIDFTQ